MFRFIIELVLAILNFAAMLLNYKTGHYGAACFNGVAFGMCISGAIVVAKEELI